MSAARGGCSAPAGKDPAEAAAGIVWTGAPSAPLESSVEAVRALSANRGAEWTDKAYDDTLRRFGRDEIVRQCERLLTDSDAYLAMSRAHNPYGDGQAVARIVNTLQNMQGRV